MSMSISMWSGRGRRLDKHLIIFACLLIHVNYYNPFAFLHVLASLCSTYIDDGRL